MKENKIFTTQTIIFSILLFFFVILPVTVGIFTDFMWFKSIDYSSIFLTELWTKIGIFLIVFVVCFLFSIGNIYVASLIKRSKFFKFEITVSIFASIFVGLIASNNWLLWLSYLNKTSFNIIDPIFAKDVSFYVFSLPFYSFIWKIALGMVVFNMFLIALHYFESLISNYFKTQQYEADPNTGLKVGPDFDFDTELKQIKRQAIIHLGILGSLFFLLIAIGNYLVKYAIMISTQGVVVGAGYVDVKVVLPFINFLMVFALFVMVFFYVWIFFLSEHPTLKRKRVMFSLIGAYFILSFFVLPVLASVFQTFVVNPNELNLEKEYLENNIKFTQKAYGIDKIEESYFNVTMLTEETVRNQKETIDNARILDYRPLEKTYKQTQEIRLYYDLSNIDIDRYYIDGEYKQVMLAAREMDQSKLSDSAKKWINLHLTYTHGMGVVMSPVNKVTKEGLPDYYIKDIPPTYTVDEPEIRIDEPRIYFGEVENSYIITGAIDDEFDYSKGDTNENVRYNGNAGVVLNSTFKKFLFAVRFSDLNILISPTITKDSKILYDRSVQKRISKITPFLTLDKDPYIVINEGKLYWIQDAYTVTGNYPYSEKFNDINYIRNSVKIVVDAYNGDVEYYVVENDPIIATYSKVFSGQFKSINDMPEGLKNNLRYPVDIFDVQSSMFGQYHMNDVTVFYNKEDTWEIPNEIYGVGKQIKVEPYYVITKLPEEQDKEFLLMTPFTPRKKDNMISWFAARCDGDNYGKLVLYKFPKDRLVYGPLQVEAKTDQDSIISEQITLWSQQGSQVTRGNMIILPLENSLIYIEPLYIQSEIGQLPELKRVLVSDGERVVMEQTIGEAIKSLYSLKSYEYSDNMNKTKENNTEKEDFQFVITDSRQEELVEKANEYYDNIQKAMESQDWSGIGENLDNLGDVLDELNK